ncbi:MAG: sulfite exporter TauE/SafE family protein [Fimbriimonadaceae bacterium]|nr:sulfite exporter TauE/SafE family protein [Fimbriimonadaceae bacterium]
MQVLTHDFAFPQDWLTLLALAVIGAVASAINAVAGGGSLISFPFMVGIGVPSVEANATNAASQWPGSIGSAVAFWNLLPKTVHYLKLLAIPTILGGTLGGWLLVASSQALFKAIVPWLILLAALLLAFQPKIKAWSLKHQKEMGPVAGVILQFFVSLYGGYFGAGMGIMMLAAFALYIEGNIHELNAMKVWLGLAINFSATVVFLVQGKIWLISCVALALGGIAGGYYAAKYSQKVNSDKLRIAIAIYGFIMVVYFFLK